MQGEGGEQIFTVLPADVDGGEKGSGHGPPQTDRCGQDIQRRRKLQRIDFLKEVEIGQGGTDHLHVGLGHPVAHRQPHDHSEQSQQTHLSQDEAKHLGSGGPHRTQQTKFQASSEQRCLGAGIDEKQTHEQTDPTKGREVQAEGPHQGSRLFFPLPRGNDLNRRSESILKTQDQFLGVGSFLDLDINLMNPSRGSQQTLNLSNVHDRQFTAGQGAHLFEIDQGTDHQLHPARTTGHVDGVSDGPPHLLGQRGRHRDPSRFEKGLGKICGRTVPGQANRSKEVHSEDLEKESITIGQGNIDLIKRPGGRHPLSGQHLAVEFLGKSGGLTQNREIHFSTHGFDSSRKGPNGISVDDLNGHQRGHPKSHPQNGEQEKAGRLPKVSDPCGQKIANHDGFRTPLWSFQTSSARLANSALWVT